MAGTSSTLENGNAGKDPVPLTYCPGKGTVAGDS